MGYRLGIIGFILIPPATRWCPPVISWFIIPLTIDISPTKTIVIGVICTNLAIERGHHQLSLTLLHLLPRTLRQRRHHRVDSALSAELGEGPGEHRLGERWGAHRGTWGVYREKKYFYQEKCDLTTINGDLSKKIGD